MLEGGYGSVEQPDNRGFTPLHMACFNNQPAIVALLLQYCDDEVMWYDFDGMSVYC